MTALPEQIPCFRCGVERKVYYRAEADGKIQRAYYGCGCGVRITAAGQGDDEATAKDDLIGELRRAWASGRDTWNVFAAGPGRHVAEQDKRIEDGEPVLREDGARPLSEKDREQLTIPQMELALNDRRNIRDIPDRRRRAKR